MGRKADSMWRRQLHGWGMLSSCSLLMYQMTQTSSVKCHLKVFYLKYRCKPGLIAWSIHHLCSFVESSLSHAKLSRVYLDIAMCTVESDALYNEMCGVIGGCGACSS